MSKVLLHDYHKKLISIEHPNPDTGNLFENLLIFIGGLGANVSGTYYITPLIKQLAPLGWGVAEVQLSSYGIGWGTGSISQDAQEMADAVQYYKSDKGGSKKKVVLIGQSTGCQDVMYYLTQQYEGDENKLSERPEVDGGILQASVSDRELCIEEIGKEKWQELLNIAKEWIEKGEGEEVLPSTFSKAFGGVPINANRWISITDVRGGEDFFSSDLTEADHAKTFGKVKTKLAVLYSEKDQAVPDYVPKEELLSKWKKATDPKYWSEHSGIIVGGNHCMNEDVDEKAHEDLYNRIKQFLSSV